MTDKQRIEIIRENLKQNYYNAKGVPDDVIGADNGPDIILSLMQPDGSFSDLNYKDQNWTSWHPYLHIIRVRALCSMVSCPHNPVYENATVIQSIHTMLQYFIDGNFHADNWWMNDVGVPSQCTVILLLFAKKLSADELAAVRRYAQGNPEKPRVFSFYSNKSADTLRPYASSICHVMSQLVDTHIHVIAQGLPPEEAMTAIRDCIRAIEWEHSVISWAPGYGPHGIGTEEDSVKADYSHQQHENGLLHNTYGNATVTDLAKLFDFWKGTDLQLSQKTAESITNLLLDGYHYMRYRGYSPQMLLGRNVAAAEAPFYYAQSMMDSFVTVCDTFLTQYPTLSRRTELQAFRACMAAPKTQPHMSGTKYFWESDYLSHNRADFQFSVHGVSMRLKRPESALKKNVLGMYLGDGCYNLLQSGREYEGIQMCLDWRRLPGVTSNLNISDEELNPESEIDTELDGQRLYGGAHGTRMFAGGASDGASGFFAMDYAHLGITARKAWFCFDEGIFCLGAAITANDGAYAYTTLNQCRLKGTVLVDGVAVQEGEHRLDSCRRVLHDGIGYILPEATQIHLKNETVCGAWSRIDRDSGTDEPIERPVFLLGVDHGENAANASYAYFLLPQTNEDALRQTAEHLPLTVLRNDKSCQAVYQPASGELQAVFYEAGALDFGESRLTVNEACAVLFKPKANGGYRFYISNPYHLAQVVRLQLEGAYNNTLLCRLAAGFRCNNLGRPLGYDSDEGFLPYRGGKTEEV